MKHYHYLICQFSAPNGLCSSITEPKHIKAVKHPYQHTNHYQALRQLLLINQWLNKLAAVHADFNECGQTKETDNQDSQVANGHGTQDEFKEQMKHWLIVRMQAHQECKGFNS
ncbi:hypothetical protein V8B97DRAFT_1917065 [Scleroderma yunnanense]